MNPYKLSLIGELIGLARATDGNEHLINASATEIVRRVLLADENCLDEAAFICLRDEVLNQKRNMVPDCFLCAAPCGKTSAYDLSAVREHQQLKTRILRDLISVSSIPDDFLYKGLIILGMDDAYPELEEFWAKALQSA